MVDRLPQSGNCHAEPFRSIGNGCFPAESAPRVSQQLRVGDPMDRQYRHQSDIPVEGLEDNGSKVDANVCWHFPTQRPFDDNPENRHWDPQSQPEGQRHALIYSDSDVQREAPPSQNGNGFHSQMSSSLGCEPRQGNTEHVWSCWQPNQHSLNSSSDRSTYPMGTSETGGFKSSALAGECDESTSVVRPSQHVHPSEHGQFVPFYPPQPPQQVPFQHGPIPPLQQGISHQPLLYNSSVQTASPPMYPSQNTCAPIDLSGTGEGTHPLTNDMIEFLRQRHQQQLYDQQLYLQLQQQIRLNAHLQEIVWKSHQHNDSHAPVPSNDHSGVIAPPGINAPKGTHVPAVTDNCVEDGTSTPPSLDIATSLSSQYPSDTTFKSRPKGSIPNWRRADSPNGSDQSAEKSGTGKTKVKALQAVPSNANRPTRSNRYVSPRARWNKAKNSPKHSTKTLPNELIQPKMSPKSKVSYPPKTVQNTSKPKTCASGHARGNGTAQFYKRQRSRGVNTEGEVQPHANPKSGSSGGSSRDTQVMNESPPRGRPKKSFPKRGNTNRFEVLDKLSQEP